MLTKLHVRDFTLLQDLSLEFGEGLSLLTGETGAGKSILVEALSLLLGGRADVHTIRSGCGEAALEADFHIGNPEDSIRRWAEEEGIAMGETLSVRRRIGKSGRSTATVNGRPVSVGRLKTLGESLVHIHGQNQGQALLDEEVHRAILDRLPKVARHAGETRRRASAISSLLSKIRTAEMGERQRSLRIETLRFQLEEIAAVSPLEGEETELRARRNRLRNAQEIADDAAALLEALRDGEGAAGGALAEALRRAESLREVLPEWKDLARDLRDASSVVAGVAMEGEQALNGLTFDPGDLENIEERLAGFEKLKRKYGPTIEEVLEHRHGLEGELVELTSNGASHEALTAELSEVFEGYKRAAEKLRSERDTAGRALQKSVVKELKGLALEKARFEVELEPRPVESPEDVRPEGTEEVRFLFSANPGEPLKPLSRVASGGELSRTMLALLTSLQGSAGPGSLVFDEVDTGIGGRPAERVGRRLRDLGGSRQVLCITHLPQIAAYAHRHIRVRKEFSGRSTDVSATLLDPEERVEELARMLAGERVTDTARKHARQLIEEAHRS